MKFDNSDVKWFLTIGILFTTFLFVCLIFTPSILAKSFFLNFSIQRVVSAVLIGIVLLTLSIALVFFEKKTVICVFANLIYSKVVFLLFFIATLILSIVISSGYRTNILLIDCILPIALLSFLFSSEAIVFQQIISRREMGWSARDSASLLNGKLDKESKIRNVVVIILIGFVISVLFHIFKGVYLGLPYPHNTFLFNPEDMFNDFFNFYDILQYRQPYFGDHQSVQYPFSNLIGLAFGKLPRNISFGVYTTLFLYAFIIFTILYTYSRNAKKHISEIFVISLLTYPILFTLDRGNIESFVFVSLLTFVFFYQKKKYALSALFLSFAIAMKLFPVVFLVVYLSDKKYKEILLTGLFTGLLTIFSLLFFKGGIYGNLIQIITGANLVRLNVFLGGDSVVQRGVSLFTLIKIYFIETDLIQKMDMVKFLGVYIKTAMAVGFFVAAYVTFMEKDFWKKIALLVIAMLLLPHVSADYKLIHIFIPLFLFINAPKTDRFDWVYIILFGLLLIPKDYFLLSKVFSDAGTADISISVIINYFVLIMMFFLITGTGLKSWIFMRKEKSKLEVV